MMTKSHASKGETHRARKRLVAIRDRDRRRTVKVYPKGEASARVNANGVRYVYDVAGERA